MRIKLAGPVEARVGQTVRFHARLPRGGTYAYCGVYSAIGRFEPSPHVDITKLDINVGGLPLLADPTTIRLAERGVTKRELKLKVQEDCAFYLYQEVDTADDLLAQAWISKDGRPITNTYRHFISALGWARRRWGR